MVMKGGIYVPRTGENIYKRKDGRWEGRFIKARDREGKAIYGYVYAKTYREVRQKLSQAVVSAPICHGNTSSTFENVAQEWYESQKMLLKVSTQNKYMNLLDSYILPEFSGLKLIQITEKGLSSYCDMLLTNGGKRKKGLSPKTVNDILSVIRSILKFARSNGYYVNCEVKPVTKKKSVQEMRVLSRNEQTQLCQYLYDNLDLYNLGILICLFTGLRIGEICALQWSDISLSEHTIRVKQTLQRVQVRSAVNQRTRVILTPPKSSCSIRTIPLPDQLYELLQLMNPPCEGYLLTGSTESYVEPRTMQYRFQRVLKNASIQSANFHALRHTFATRCIELGFDVKSLSEILGHATVNITMNRYVHPSMELKKQNMQRLSELISVK